MISFAGYCIPLQRRYFLYITIMKIITWNCNMAFRKKASLVLVHRPDILIVQECEHPSKINFGAHLIQPTGSLWLGSNQNKGLGVFTFGGFACKIHISHNPELKLIAPVKISNGQLSLMLYAIWAHNPEDKEGQYITQVWKALRHYDKKITKKQTILAGDFNSNTIWDKPRREGNHSTVVSLLASKKIASVYHKYFSQTQGKESHPTFYLYKNRNKPYHLDYCFVSSDLMSSLSSVEVGDFDSWVKYSDHVPLILDFDIHGL
jgi:exodeoxyribonuclease III